MKLFFCPLASYLPGRVHGEAREPQRRRRRAGRPPAGRRRRRRRRQRRRRRRRRHRRRRQLVDGRGQAPLFHQQQLAKRVASLHLMFQRLQSALDNKDDYANEKVETLLDFGSKPSHFLVPGHVMISQKLRRASPGCCWATSAPATAGAGRGAGDPAGGGRGRRTGGRRRRRRRRRPRRWPRRRRTSRRARPRRWPGPSRRRPAVAASSTPPTPTRPGSGCSAAAPPLCPATAGYADVNRQTQRKHHI